MSVGLSPLLYTSDGHRLFASCIRFRFNNNKYIAVGRGQSHQTATASQVEDQLRFRVRPIYCLASYRIDYIDRIDVINNNNLLNRNKMKVSANLSNCRLLFSVISVVVFSGFLLVNVCVAVNEELFCHKKGDDCVDKNRVEDHSFLGKKFIRRKCKNK